MRLVLLFSIAVSSYCFKFSLRWSKTINKSTKYSKSSQFQLYSSAGNFNSSVPDNQNMNSLAPISDVNIYGNMLESSAGSISKDFIPTGPPALTQYDKKTTFKNSAIMNSKRL